MGQCQVSESGHPSPTAQRSQCQLVHVLLLWITILTISQVMFLAFFFTAGTLFSLGDQQQQEYGTLEYQVKEDKYHVNSMKTKINWKTLKTSPLVKSGDNDLTIQQDGSYYLYLQVTLGHRGNAAKEHMVRLQRLDPEVILMEGRLTNSTITMFQGKSEVLSSGDTLVVTVYPEADINTTRTATYLGIIYQPKIILPSYK